MNTWFVCLNIASVRSLINNKRGKIPNKKTKGKRDSEEKGKQKKKKKKNLSSLSMYDAT